MASFVLSDAYFYVATSDLSDYMTGGTLNVAGDVVESQTMGDTWKERLAGLKDWNFDVEFNADFGDNLLDEVMFAFVGTAQTCKVAPVGGTPSTANPVYTGSAICTSYTPFSGSVGTKATASAHFEGAGALDRDITP